MTSLIPATCKITNPPAATSSSSTVTPPGANFASSAPGTKPTTATSISGFNPSHRVGLNRHHLVAADVGGSVLSCCPKRRVVRCATMKLAKCASFLLLVLPVCAPARELYEIRTLSEQDLQQTYTRLLIDACHHSDKFWKVAPFDSA